MVRSPQHALPILLVLLGSLSCTETDDDDAAEDALFTLVALPDTQKYSDDYPETFAAQTNWVVDHADELNIQFVTQLGDVVHNGPNERQWENARSALQILEEANIRYGVGMGNHDSQYSDWEYSYDGSTDDSCSDVFSDIDCSAEHFLANAGPSFIEEQDGYGGASDSGLSHYSHFEFEGFDFLFLHLHVDPRAAEVAWAQTVLDEHPGSLVHISTHRYLYDYRLTDTMPDPLPLFTGGRFNAAVHAMGGQDLIYVDSMPAEELFETFIAVNPNIFMVQCGHVDAEYRQESLNDDGLPVFEILTDFETYHPDGGSGWMKLLTFNVTRGTIDVTTYSPTLDETRHNGDGIDASLEALQDGLSWFGGYLEQLGLDPDELQDLMDYWTTTDEGRQDYLEAAYGDGSRDSEFTLDIDFAAYATAR